MPAIETYYLSPLNMWQLLFGNLICFLRKPKEQKFGLTVSHIWILLAARVLLISAGIIPKWWKPFAACFVIMKPAGAGTCCLTDIRQNWRSGFVRLPLGIFPRRYFFLIPAERRSRRRLSP